MRGLAVVVVGLVVVGGCGKGGGTKPYVEAELETQHQALQDIELDIKVPKGMKAETKSGVEVRWLASTANDTLDITIQVATPSVLQNAINFEGQTDRRVTRSETTADGWVITSGDQGGGTLISKRMIQKDRRALFCTAMVTWAKPGHDAKRTAWVEGICNSLTATKFE